MRKSIYPTQEEKDVKSEQYQQTKKKEEKQMIANKEKNGENLHLWLEQHLSNYNPNYESKKSHSTSFLDDNSEQKLFNKLYKKYKISSPKMTLGKNQIYYLLDIMEEDEKKERFVQYHEERKLEMVKREKQRANDVKYRKEKQLKINEWKNWYHNAKNVSLEPIVFKTDLSAKKAEKRDLGKMKKMFFFRYICDHFYSLSEFSSLDNNVLIHLYRVKLGEDKLSDKNKELEKVKKYIERERLLEEKCVTCGVNYIRYNKLPGKSWKTSKKWTQWSEIDNERKKNINKNIGEAKRNIEWNKLSIDGKKEVIDFHKEWKRLESEHLLSLPDPQPRYRQPAQQNEVIYTDTGYSLTIDPKWSSERRQEEIESFKQAVRDF